MDQEFKPSASQPIASIIKHFNLPELPAYCLAHLILMQNVTKQVEKSRPEQSKLRETVFSDLRARHGKGVSFAIEVQILTRMENEMRKHRGMEPV